MEELRTCDSILSWLKDQTENKRPISPHLYLEAATALNILSSDEVDKLIDMESELAKARAQIGGTAAGAKIAVEALPLYGEARKQRAKIEMIKEAVRLAKRTAVLKSDEMRSGL